MYNLKTRMNILLKLAETDIPSLTEVEEIKQEAQQAVQKSNLGTPPSFLASARYALILGFEQNAVFQIDKIVNYLNQALFYASGGKYNLNYLAQNNFNITVPTSDREVRLLLGFSKDLYTWLLNNGAPYKEKLNKEAFEYRINKLLSTYSLNNLSQVNVTGPLASKLGNIKVELINSLNLLKKFAPSK